MWKHLPASLYQQHQAPLHPKEKKMPCATLSNTENSYHIKPISTFQKDLLYKIQVLRHLSRSLPWICLRGLMQTSSNLQHPLQPPARSLALRGELRSVDQCSKEQNQ